MKDCSETPFLTTGEQPDGLGKKTISSVRVIRVACNILEALLPCFTMLVVDIWTLPNDLEVIDEIQRPVGLIS